MFHGVRISFFGGESRCGGRVDRFHQIVQLVYRREDGMKERRRHDHHRLQGHKADIRTDC